MTKKKERQNLKHTNYKTIISMNSKDFYSTKDNVDKVSR